MGALHALMHTPTFSSQKQFIKAVPHYKEMGSVPVDIGCMTLFTIIIKSTFVVYRDILIVHELAAKLFREHVSSSDVALKIRAIDGSVKWQLSSSPSLCKFIQVNDRGCGSSTSPRALALRDGSSPKSHILFSVECDSSNLGESVGIVGECEELGIWEKAVRMTTAEQVRR